MCWDFRTRSDHAGERCLGGRRSDKWSALINGYITVIPLIGGEPCIAMQSMSGWPLKNPVHIAAALDTSIATVERTRRQLVEEGFEAVLARKYNSNSAPRRILL
jgi:hypothetical protein